MLLFLIAKYFSNFFFIFFVCGLDKKKRTRYEGTPKKIYHYEKNYPSFTNYDMKRMTRQR